MSKQATQAITPNNSIVCTNAQGLQITGNVIQVSPYLVVFEVFHPELCVRLSEVFSNFKITVQNSVAYSGRAVISKFINLGTQLLCEAILEDPWVDNDIFSGLGQKHGLVPHFKKFLRDWEKLYQILPELKILIADMESFLTDLRIWVNQVELGIRSSPSGNALEQELEVVDELSSHAIPVINALVEKFEYLGERIDPELKPAHHTYIKRQLHPLLLCAPFAYRTYHKPLGYAGDYEMVNMILRDPREGASLFAKLLNVWFVKQPVAQAHRNRIDYLGKRLQEEAARMRFQGHPGRFYNLGCGPAHEIQNFLRESEISNDVDLTLLDFNDETLDYARTILHGVRQKFHRRTHMTLVRKSVAQVLRAAEKASEKARYDFVYCAGLFDYLPNHVNTQLIQYFYRMTAPGGLVVVTNVDTSNPNQQVLDYVLEWHLLYRDGKSMIELCPKEIPEEEIKVHADETGVNLFLEIRKPSK